LRQKHPLLSGSRGAASERLQNSAAAIQSSAKRGKIAIRDVNVRRLRHDFFERPQVAVNIAEDQNFHGASPRPAGAMRLMCC